MTDAPPRTPELTAEKHGSTSSSGAKKRRKKSKSNNGNANWNTTNGADNNEGVDADPESSQTVAPSLPSNGVNGVMHAAPTSPKSTSSKQLLQNI
eukprot:scaffold37596_cov124-Skeletonema_marinoi.AAC.1